MVLITYINLIHIPFIYILYRKIKHNFTNPLKCNTLLEYSYGILGLKRCIQIDDAFDANAFYD